MGSYLKICLNCKSLTRFLEDVEGLCPACLEEQAKAPVKAVRKRGAKAKVA